jgi:retron-type reverse transcriptase
VENLLVSWREFLRGKKKRKDVAEFSLNFLDNILTLREELVNKTYQHGGYQAFKINDPKPRDIHKASVRDRLVHHAIHRILCPHFDRKFIFDSYSCRLKKGTYQAINRCCDFAGKVSKNNTRTCWVLKCDIRKFFANIDHKILKDILEKYIADEDVLWLIAQVINSFETKGKYGVGLPLGNLTSQLMVNIYMNEFDQFAKRKLKVKYYVRYCDDFVVVSENKNDLKKLVPTISEFLETRLALSLNPDKLFIKTFSSGVDFLGWVNFPHHRVLRTSTKRRMTRRLNTSFSAETISSYLGLLLHGNTGKLSNEIKEFVKSRKVYFKITKS